MNPFLPLPAGFVEPPLPYWMVEAFFVLSFLLFIQLLLLSLPQEWVDRLFARKRTDI